MNPVLFEAIRDGNLVYLQNVEYAELLKVMADQEDTALHVAVNFEKQNMVNSIINRSRWLLHKKNSNGDSPLHLAARRGSHAMVQLLLDRAKAIEVERRNALLNLRNRSNDTALHDAVRNGHLKVVRLLIVADPDLALARNDAGDSSLFLAVDLQLYEIARMIIAANNHPDSYKGRNNMNVLHAAIIRAEKRYGTFSARIVTSFPFLNKCFSYRLEYIGEDFMDTVQKTDQSTIFQPDTYGWIPLHYAAKVGHTEVFRVLLRYDISLALVKNKKGISAIHISARNGHSDIVQLLMDTCPDTLGLLDNKGRTALHIATEKGRSNVVRAILMASQLQDHLINARDENGNTALQLAALAGQGNTFFILLNDARVNKRVVNKAGLTTIDIIQTSTLLQDFTKSVIMRKLRVKGDVKSLERELLKNNKKEGATKSQEQDQSQKSKRESEAAAGGKNEKFKIIQERSSFNLGVSTIIASMTFPAISNLPGGLSESDNNGTKIVKASLSEDQDFKGFIWYNSVAFGIAFSSIVLHFAFFAARKPPNAAVINCAFLNYLSMIAMFITYLLGLAALLPESLFSTAFLAAYFSVIFSFILFYPMVNSFLRMFIFSFFSEGARSFYIKYAKT